MTALRLRPTALLSALLLALTVALVPAQQARADATFKVGVLTLFAPVGPVPNVQITVSRWDQARQAFVFVGSGRTGSNGMVDMPSTPGGLFKVDASAHQYKPTTSYIQNVASEPFTMLVVMDPVANGSATVTGRVTGADGQPLDREWVHLTPAEGGHRIDTVTSQGTATFTNVPAGRYLFHVAGSTVDSASPTLTTWAPSTAERAKAVRVEVADGANVTLPALRQLRGARIEGHLRTVPAQGRGNVEVTDLEGTPVGWGYVNSDGTYRTPAIQPGRYLLRFSGEVRVGEQSMPLITQWWRGRYLPETAVPVTLRAGQVLRGMDITLTRTLTAWQNPSFRRTGKRLVASRGRWSKEGYTAWRYTWSAKGRTLGTAPSLKLSKKMVRRIGGKKALRGKKVAVTLTVRATDTRDRFLPGVAVRTAKLRLR